MRPERPAALWAAAGVAAGGLGWVSPWLGLGTGLGLVGYAWWRQQRRPGAGSPLPSGDLASPWPDGGMEPLRQDLLGLWQRFQAATDVLQQAMTRLTLHEGEWERMLQRGVTDLDTVSRSVLTQKGAAGRAIEAVSAALGQWQALQRQWAGVTESLSELAAWTGQQAQMAQAVQHRTSDVAAAWQEVCRSGDAAIQVLESDPSTDPSGGLAALIAGAGTIADEAGKLGKAGWPVALAATSWADEARATLEALTASRPDWEGFVTSGERLREAIGACQPFVDQLQSATRELQTTAPAVPPAQPPPAPDLESVATRLDVIDREAELAAGLAQDQATRLAGMQQRLKRLSEGLEKAKHTASELLILSGYVRTAPTMPACHLNRTVWCITDGVCERCPLTRLSEADFPHLLGVGARHAPTVAKTGRTIDLDPDVGG